MRLRMATVALAVLAIVLGVGVGLRRRAWRLHARALVYGREASRLERMWNSAGAMRPDDLGLLMEQVHWDDAVADEYRLAAAHPWLPFDPESNRIMSKCGFHMARKPVTVKRPRPGA
jgi:hypothetical protein